MNLLVNGILVKTEMNPYTDAKGFVLHLFIASDNSEVNKLHAKMEKVLEFECCGVMSSEEVKDGFSEIRVVEHTSLEIVDFLRMDGFGIVEQPINQ